MNPEEKTRDILEALDRRPNFTPRSRPRDSKISSIDRLPWKSSFSLFNPSHVRVAAQLTELLLNAKDFDEYMDIINEVKESENDGLFLYTLYSSVRHRNDTDGVVLPPIEERSPHWFFAAETIHEAIQLSIHQPNADHLVTNQRTSDITDDEGRLAYFREDIGMNRHHWSWHLVYPVYWNAETMGRAKDRKGEIFYYMHQQMLARYDSERLSNGLNRVVPLQNFESEMEGYFPHMSSRVTGTHLSARPPGLRMRSVNEASVHDMEVNRLRILDAIDRGYVRDTAGNRTPLGNNEGINVLGAVIEASSDSINQAFYGNLHNNGHQVISACHDPDDKFRQPSGVMGFNESAARDPMFYRWHKLIDNMFTRHKSILTPYSREELSFEGIKVLNAEIQATRKNVVETFMRDARSDLSHAPFLTTKGKILVKYEHLDHEPFKISYNIQNNTRGNKEVYIRVFLAPKYDFSGSEFLPNEQRRLMIELDKIQTCLRPGPNVITREDIESSVSAPREMRSYRALKAGNVTPQLGFCTCGWPQHLLIPKGTLTGMDFNLFVMITDYTEDKPKEVRCRNCRGAVSYCGSRDDKYPDTKPMGFPFDRRILQSSMTEFLTDNMFVTDFKVIFSNEVRPVTQWTAENYGKR